MNELINLINAITPSHLNALDYILVNAGVFGFITAAVKHHGKLKDLGKGLVSIILSLSAISAVLDTVAKTGSLHTSHTNYYLSLFFSCVFMLTTVLHVFVHSPLYTWIITNIQYLKTGKAVLTPTAPQEPPVLEPLVPADAIPTSVAPEYDEFNQPS